MNPVIIAGAATLGVVLIGVAFVVLVFAQCRRVERAAHRPPAIVPTLPGKNPLPGRPAEPYSALDAWRRAKTSALEEGAPRERIT